MKFAAILFDLDGTLLNTLDDIADSANSALVELGYPAHPVEAYKIFVGDGLENLARRALPEDCRDEETVSNTIPLILDQYIKHANAKTRPYDGIPELLDGLIEMNLPMSVFSNKEDVSTKVCIGQFLAKWSFVSVMGTGGAVPIKPDPTGAIMTAKAVGVAPGKFCYVGDTNTDMQTAIAAGMYPVGASWGFRQADELLANGAKAIIDHPVQLLDLH